MSYGEYSIFTHSDAFWLLPLQHTSLKRFEHGEKCLVDSDRSIVVPRGSPESGWFTAVFFLCVFLVGVAAACLVLFLASPGMSTSSQGNSD